MSSLHCGHDIYDIGICWKTKEITFSIIRKSKLLIPVFNFAYPFQNYYQDKCSIKQDDISKTSYSPSFFYPSIGTKEVCMNSDNIIANNDERNIIDIICKLAAYFCSFHECSTADWGGKNKCFKDDVKSLLDIIRTLTVTASLEEMVLDSLRGKIEELLLQPSLVYQQFNSEVKWPLRDKILALSNLLFICHDTTQSITDVSSYSHAWDRQEYFTVALGTAMKNFTIFCLAEDNSEFIPTEIPRDAICLMFHIYRQNHWYCLYPSYCGMQFQFKYGVQEQSTPIVPLRKISCNLMDASERDCFMHEMQAFIPLLFRSYQNTKLLILHEDLKDLNCIENGKLREFAGVTRMSLMQIRPQTYFIKEHSDIGGPLHMNGLSSYLQSLYLYRSRGHLDKFIKNLVFAVSESRLDSRNIFLTSGNDDVGSASVIALPVKTIERIWRVYYNQPMNVAGKIPSTSDLLEYHTRLDEFLFNQVYGGKEGAALGAIKTINVVKYVLDTAQQGIIDYLRCKTIAFSQCFCDWSDPSALDTHVRGFLKVVIQNAFDQLLKCICPPIEAHLSAYYPQLPGALIGKLVSMAITIRLFTPQLLWPTTCPGTQCVYEKEVYQSLEGAIDEEAPCFLLLPPVFHGGEMEERKGPMKTNGCSPCLSYGGGSAAIDHRVLFKGIVLKSLN